MNLSKNLCKPPQEKTEPSLLPSKEIIMIGIPNIFEVPKTFLVHNKSPIHCIGKLKTLGTQESITN